MRTRFAIALTAVCLLLAGCHASWQSAGGVWYLTSTECADGFSRIWIDSPSLNQSGMAGTTGAFEADSQGCHPLGLSLGYVQVEVDLYKQNAGLCVPGTGWHSNTDGSYAASVSDPIDYICGTGNYFTLATNYVHLPRGGDQYHWTNSPGDHYG